MKTMNKMSSIVDAIIAWQKNKSVEMTSPGSKNKYKVTYWNGKEKWTDDKPGDGKGGRREERLKEKKQSRPSLQDAKQKLEKAYLSYVDGNSDESGLKQVVDDVIVKLGRELSREVIGDFIRAKGSVEGREKEALGILRQKKIDRLRKKESSQRVSFVIQKGWLDKTGKFYSFPSGQTHEDFAEKRVSAPPGLASEELLKLGWLRVVPYGRDSLSAEARAGMKPNTSQFRELRDMAIEWGMDKIVLDNVTSFKVIWSDDARLVANQGGVMKRHSGELLKLAKILVSNDYWQRRIVEESAKAMIRSIDEPIVVYSNYLTYTYGTSSKYHMFLIYEYRDADTGKTMYVGLNTYGPIGKRMTFFELARGPMLGSVRAKVMQKEQAKINKGYS